MPDKISSFVHRQNLREYQGRLLTETDPAVRGVLVQLVEDAKAALVGIALKPYTPPAGPRFEMLKESHGDLWKVVDTATAQTVDVGGFVLIHLQSEEAKGALDMLRIGKLKPVH
jgi:hypothetical protein